MREDDGGGVECCLQFSAIFPWWWWFNIVYSWCKLQSENFNYYVLTGVNVSLWNIEMEQISIEMSFFGHSWSTFKWFFFLSIFFFKDTKSNIWIVWVGWAGWSEFHTYVLYVLCVFDWMLANSFTHFSFIYRSDAKWRNDIAFGVRPLWWNRTEEDA